MSAHTKTKIKAPKAQQAYRNAAGVELRRRDAASATGEHAVAKRHGLDCLRQLEL
jgi:hypothetical protein